MEDDARRLMSGEAWREFCDRLKATGERILGDDHPSSPHDRAEGYRYLTRLVAYAVRSELEAGDPGFPQLIRYEEPFTQWGGPNPDNTYLRAPIDPAGCYRVHGDVRGMRQAIFSLQEGDMQLGRYGVFSEQSMDDMRPGSDGRLELWIAPERPREARNWMPTHPDARIFQVRIYLSDWERDASPALHIERVDGDALPPLPEPAAVARGLDRAGRWVEASAAYWNRYTAAGWERATPNVAAPAGATPGGADNILYGSCFWDLAEDQALLLSCDEPDAQYWGFCFHTLGWLESGDFANRQTSLSGHQIHTDADGRVRLVLAHEDPGTPNWIDIAGRPRGLLVYRFVWARSNPKPEASVVPLARVRAHLPQDHPVVDAGMRREALRRRRQALWSRYL